MTSIINWFKKHLSSFIRTIGVMTIAVTCLGIISSIFMIKDIDTEYYNMTNNFFIKTVQWFEQWEEAAYDARVRYHQEKLAVADGPVLIEIDDETLNKLGTYPIPRNFYTNMVNTLKNAGAKVIALDILLAEKSTNACEVDQGPTVDDVLAETMANFQGENDERSVILGYTVERGLEDPVDPPFSLLTSMLNVQGVLEEYNEEKRKLSKNGNNLYFMGIEKYNFPIDLFTEQNLHLGYINNSEDYDGVYRHYTLFARVLSHELQGSLFVPALGLRAYISSLDQVEGKLNIYPSGSSKIEVGDRKIEVNAKGGIKIKWFGSKTFYPSVSLKELLFPEEPGKFRNKHVWKAYHDAKKNLSSLEKSDPEYETIQKKYKEIVEAYKDHLYVDLKEKVVFVGSSAAGAHDLRNTPIDPVLPGVYAHMNLAHMFETNTFLKPHHQSERYSQLLLVAALLILTFIMFFNKAILDIVALLVISYSLWLIDEHYFYDAGYEISLVYIIVSLVASYLWVTILNFNQASAERKQIKGAFSRYVAPAVVNDMLENPDKLKVGGERKDITCLFSDVRDFTSISEKLTPTELASSLNRYMGEMTDIVFETEGTLDKYIGDAIVAFWGAPLDVDDHVNQAMDASVKMLEALPAINEEFRSKNIPEFKIGLGLNSGVCSVGNMGSDAIFEYTALGDNMNLGARLESLCKHYGAQILVSEYTYAKMDKERFKSRLIDNVRVKGKTEPVGVYEIMYSYHPLELNPAAFDHFNEGYVLFIEGKFKEAQAKFEKVLSEVETDKASQRLFESCQHWIENPPKEDEDWTITTMTTK